MPYFYLRLFNLAHIFLFAGGRFVLHFIIHNFALLIYIQVKVFVSFLLVVIKCSQQLIHKYILQETHDHTFDTLQFEIASELKPI